MRRRPSGLWMVINPPPCDEVFDSARLNSCNLTPDSFISLILRDKFQPPNVYFVARCVKP